MEHELVGPDGEVPPSPASPLTGKPRACVPCNRRHLRCNGKDLCNNCEGHPKYAAMCHYPTRRDGRKAAKAEEANRMEREILALRERLLEVMVERDNYSQKFQETAAQYNNLATQFGVPMLAAEPASPLSTREAPSLSPCLSPASGCSELPSTPGSPSTGAGDLVEDFLSHNIRTRRFDEHTEPLALRQSPYFFAGRPTPSSRAAASPIGAVAMFGTLSTDDAIPAEQAMCGAWSQLAISSGYAWCGHIPDEILRSPSMTSEFHCNIIDFYFDGVAFWYIAVIPDRFRAEMKEALEKPFDIHAFNGRLYSPALHLMILWAGLSHMLTSGTEYPEEVRGWVDLLEHHAVHWVRRQYVRNVATMSTALAAAVHAGGLAAHTGGIRLAYLHARNAIVIARSLGLNLPAEDWLSRWSYLALFIQHAFISIHAGLDLAAMDLPVEFASETTNPCHTEQFQLFLATASLIHIVAQMTKSFDDRSRPASHFFGRYHTALLEWSRLHAHILSVRSDAPCVQLLQMTYHWACVLLVRPVYAFDTERRKISDDACHFFTEIQKRFAPRPPTRPPLTLVPMVFTIGLASLVASTFLTGAQVARRRVLLSCVDSAITALQSLGRTFPCALDQAARLEEDRTRLHGSVSLLTATPSSGQAFVGRPRSASDSSPPVASGIVQQTRGRHPVARTIHTKNVLSTGPRSGNVALSTTNSSFLESTSSSNTLQPPPGTIDPSMLSARPLNVTPVYNIPSYNYNVASTSSIPHAPPIDVLRSGIPVHIRGRSHDSIFPFYEQPSHIVPVCTLMVPSGPVLGLELAPNSPDTEPPTPDFILPPTVRVTGPDDQIMMDWMPNLRFNAAH